MDTTASRFGKLIGVATLIVILIGIVSARRTPKIQEETASVDSSNSRVPTSAATLAEDAKPSTYQSAATELLRLEAEELIRDLRLVDPVPSKASDLAEVYIAPASLSTNIFGSIKTANYSFSAARDAKLSYVSRWFAGTAQNDYLNNIRTRATFPVSNVDTNAAIRTALEWLLAARANVGALQIDGEPEVYYWPLGSEKFVPLYRVFWFKRGAPHTPGTELARVSFFEPDNELLTLRIEDPKYNLRVPLRVPL